MFQTKIVQKIKTHILFSIHFFPENYTVYETMWRNVVEIDATEENIICGMHSA